MSILAVEDALIAACRAALGTRVRTVESLPGDWDEELFSRLFRAVPAVFVSFGGGPAGTGSTQNQATIDARWTLIACTGHARGEAARRRGDSQQIGAYEMLMLVVPRVHGLVVPGVGGLRLVDLANLYSGTLDGKGLAVYVATFAMPLSFELVADEALLAPFETFTAQYDLPPLTTEAEHRKWLAGDYSTSRPDATDTVQLPQA